MNREELVKEIRERLGGFYGDDLNTVAQLLGQWSQIQGFSCSWENVPEKLMLIVTELAEAMEAYRNNDLSNFEEEIADVAIRTFDLCGRLRIDLREQMAQKMEKNFQRPYMHGRKC